jgi:3-oxoacyl-[acyl-carrier-protein] synthase-3
MTGVAGVYLTPLALSLGDPVPIDQLDDPGVSANLSALKAQGITTTRVSKAPTARLAADVTPRDLPFDAIVVCSETIEYGSSAEWVLRYRAETCIPGVRVLFVGGSMCANLAAGLDVATGLLASGDAQQVLLVTVDHAVPGGRHPRLSMTVFADGAASCVVTTVPAGPSFEVLHRVTRSWQQPVAGASEMAYARELLAATRSAVTGMVEPNEITHLLTPNYGNATCQLLALASGVPAERRYRGMAGNVGHCFAADTLLNLDHLTRGGTVANADTVLALMSSDNALSAVLLRYRG